MSENENTIRKALGKYDEVILRYLFKHSHIIFRLFVIGFFLIIFSHDSLFTIMESSIIIIAILIFIMDDIHKLTNKK